MPQFPEEIFTPREMVNLPGLTRDEADTKNLYAEDYNEATGEIVAVEEILGTEPQGEFETVKARIEALEASASPLNPTPNDVTGSRSADGTVYQNTSGKAMFVSINVTLVNSGGPGYVEFYAFIGATDSPDIFIADLLLQNNTIGEGGSENFIQNLTFFVPKDWYYNLTLANDTYGSGSVNYWYECY